jgi:hypothetical protein
MEDSSGLTAQLESEPQYPGSPITTFGDKRAKGLGDWRGNQRQRRAYIEQRICELLC